MKSFKKMFIANSKEYIRDGGILFLSLVFPVILIFIFGIIFGGEIEEYTFNIGVIRSESEIYQKVIDNFDDNKEFNLFVSTEAEEIAALKKGDRDIVIKMSNVSYGELSAEENYEVEVFYDTTRSDTNLGLIGYLKELFVEIEDSILNTERKISIISKGLNEDEKVSTFHYILPGILALALMQLGLFGSLDFLNLREKKIIRGLSVTPLSRSALLSSELVLRVLIGFVQAIIIMSCAYLFFGVTISGSLVYLSLLVLLGSLTFTSIGYLLICFVKSAVAGNGLVQIMQLVLMFLSGIFFPIEVMPTYLMPIMRIMPLTYLADALRQVILGISGEYSMMMNVSVLFISLIITTLLTVKLWRWE